MVFDNTIEESEISAKNELTPLLPERHTQPDLFICDVADACLKDVMQMMEHPFFSLSKKPVREERIYASNDGHWIEIIPSVKGLATIYDKDILIYSISQIMAQLNKGEPVCKRVRMNTVDVLRFANRGISGREYLSFAEGLDRLAGTRIATNIVTGKTVKRDNFGLINASSIVREEDKRDGRLLWVEVELSDWVFDAIEANEVLTLHKDYFSLRKPLERRVYEIARKHCGPKREWMISLENLYKKSGSSGHIKQFKFMVKGLIEHNHLPDYMVAMQGNNVVFLNRGTIPVRQGIADHSDSPRIALETFEQARRIAPGYDVHHIHQEWLYHWLRTGKPELADPDKAFLGFCRIYHRNNPLQ